MRKRSSDFYKNKPIVYVVNGHEGGALLFGAYMIAKDAEVHHGLYCRRLLFDPIIFTF